MKRAAQLLAWLLLSLSAPAYYSACAMLVLHIVGAINVEWTVIVGLATFAPVAIVFDVLVKYFISSAEPSGSLGAKDQP